MKVDFFYKGKPFHSREMLFLPAVGTFHSGKRVVEVQDLRGLDPVEGEVEMVEVDAIVYLDDYLDDTG